MIFAEIEGKLGRGYERAHERGEDLFTSTVLGLLRYLPLAEGLLSVLGQARQVELTASGVTIRHHALGLDEVRDYEIKFWPSLGKFGEPDVLLTLRDVQGRPVHLILIEAKLYSPKSGRAAEDQEVDEERPDPDQLVRYWQGLGGLPGVQEGVAASLIYLTSHGAPPLGELAASLDRHRQSAMRLFWLSWRDVWQVVRRVPSSLPAHDLEALLAHKGLVYFTGFHAAPRELKLEFGLPNSGRFFTKWSRHFGWRAPAETMRFWHTERGSFWKACASFQCSTVSTPEVALFWQRENGHFLLPDASKKARGR